MKVRVEDNNIIIYESQYVYNADGYTLHSNMIKEIVKVDALELAKALKPYLDTLTEVEK